MAPKVATVEKGSKRKAGSSDDAEKPSSDAGPMDPKEVSKMLGSLKYKQAYKGDEHAKVALEKYRSLPPSEKHKFLSAYQKGGKDLSWIHSFSASWSAETKESSQVSEGYFYKSHLLCPGS